MSAALQLPMVWGVSTTQRTWTDDERKWDEQPVARADVKTAAKAAVAAPDVSLAFYRNHTEKMLRRYLYASMQVGRTPSILGDSVGRGWCSSRPVQTFEDAVIFVLDMETCLDQLGSLDREMLSRVVLQEYTQAEAASLIGMSVRSICTKLPQAVDRLTEKLLRAGLLVLPD
jgi:DNA-directed RNA polymerase specialized sigma24 family protein